MKLRLQIILIFLIASLLVVGTSAVIYYHYVRQIIINQSVNQLHSVSEAKRARIRAILDERIRNVDMLKKNIPLNKQLKKYLEDPTAINQIALYSALIQAKEDIHGVNKIVLTDSSGKVILKSSTKIHDSETDYSHHSCIKKLARHKITHTYAYNTDNKLVFTFATHIYRNYVILIEFDVNDIHAVLLDYSGLGKSGESFLIEKNGEDSIRIISPLRFSKNIFHSLPINSFYKEALSGKNSIYRDVPGYRKKNVIASTKYIDYTGWAIISQMDVDENLDQVRQLQSLTLMVALSIIFLMFIFIYLYAYYFVKPINDIAETARKISEGDLTHRVRYKSNNELGTLARAFNDMTDKLLETQKELESKIKELNRSNEELDRYAHVISHDLKSPLNSLKGLLDIFKLEYKNKLDAQGEQMIYMMEEQLKNMKLMIKGMLEYAEVKSNIKQIEEIDLNVIVSDIIKNMFVPTHINISIISTLPTIKIERILIQQIFQNLISNAVKYMDKEKGEIKIGCTENTDHYTFYVSDNGPGIDKKYHEKIFELFKTASVEKSYNSSGIGLAIVKKIIQDKQGDIWLTSEQGIGTTFYFKLPKS
ncbi:MAG: sensor histidine kinase [Cytophagaceae bacterium]|nr:sensor histidine kinase [Cytophagaceae bacterium]MDW8456693.1 sensor histidine kinase [Cytophagaceae bacterium]